MAEQIDIAIIGAGIVSLCLAVGLSKRKNLTVRIYEARDELGHDGSGFGIAANGQQAMELIDPAVLTCLERAGAVSSPGLRFMIGTGPHSGEEISAQSFNHPVKTVRRSNLLHELQQLLDPHIIQLGRRLAAIEDGPAQSRLLVFEDGAKVRADAVLGCDGVNSYVRRHILGPSHPAAAPEWSTGYNTRIMVPLAQAISIFGEDYCAGLAASGWQTGWIGSGGFCMTDFEDNSNTMQVIAGGNKGEIIDGVFGKPFCEVDEEFWISRLREWGWIGERMSEVVKSQDRHFVATGRGHLATPKYNNGSMCIAGDAARTFPPFRGAGAGQGLEDALMLSVVLGEVKGRSAIPRALQVYNDLRQPRREAVAEASLQASSLLQGKAGLDKDFLARECADWNHWIHHFDLEKQSQEAKNLMQSKM